MCSGCSAELSRATSAWHAPVFLPPPPIDPECESSGCDCDDEFDSFYAMITGDAYGRE